jgi:hypothetical protein
MKKVLLFVGVILVLLGVFQGGRYIFDYELLSSYGKGYVMGSGLLFLLGVLLIYFGLKKKKTDA